MKKAQRKIQLSQALKDEEDYQKSIVTLCVKPPQGCSYSNFSNNQIEHDSETKKQNFKDTKQQKLQSNGSINEQNKLFNNFTASNFKNIDYKSPNLQQIKNQIIKQKDNSSRFHKRKIKQNIKSVISNQKINSLKSYFIQKLKRNNQYSTPVYHVFQEDQKNISFLDIKGIQIRQNIDIALNLVFFLNIIASIYIISLSLVFQNIKDSSIYYWYKIINFFIFASEIILNFISVRFCLGKKLDIIKLISRDYIKNRFNVDLINILVIFCNIFTDQWLVNLMSMVTLLKLPECMQKLQKLQVYFIQNYYNEQYWQLIKVLIFNFCFAHILSVLLIGMASLNNENNWIKQKNLQNAPWAQIYIWAYYWGTTLMLTIGFGDITPVCSQQAVCMVFIQTISCIILAYNINCVGTLISNIRHQDLQKSKKLKIFRKLNKKNKMNEENSWKINNYIQQNSNMKKLFNIEEQKNFTDALPVAYRTEYLKQANKAIFNQLFFLGSLMQNTLFSLAENIEMKVTHPQEVILQKNSNLDLFILKAGQVGLLSQKKNRTYSQYIIDRISIKENQNPFLLSTNFITTQRSSYVFKSIIYSVLYILNRDKLLSILRQNPTDFQIFCMMKDKCKYKIDQFEVFVCQYCNTKHTKFDCPKLHYIPIHQHTINKFLHVQKVNKNKRFNDFQRQKLYQSALANYSFYKQIYIQNSKKKQQKLNQQVKKINLGVMKQLKTMMCQYSYDANISYENIQKDTFSKLQKSIIQNTEELMRYYLSKTLNNSPCQDPIWILDLDHMKNYKNYFCLDNPCNIDKKYDIDERLKIIQKKQLNSALASILKDKIEYQQKMQAYRHLQQSSHYQNLIQDMRQKTFGREKTLKYKFNKRQL